MNHKELTDEQNLGWIKLHRKLLSSQVFLNDGLFKIWIWCLLKASHDHAWVRLRNGRGEIQVEVERGSFVFGRKTASKELNMPERTVYDRILKLAKMQNIAIISNSHYSIISICNYEYYQNSKLDEATANPTTNQQPTNTDKNVENIKKKTYPPEFSIFWDAYPSRNGHKVGKMTTYGLWCRVPQAERASLIEAVKAYSASKTVMEGFIRDPERFLKNLFWHDWVPKANASLKAPPVLEINRQPSDLAASPLTDGVSKIRDFIEVLSKRKGFSPTELDENERRSVLRHQAAEMGVG